MNHYEEGGSYSCSHEVDDLRSIALGPQGGQARWSLKASNTKILTQYTIQYKKNSPR